MRMNNITRESIYPYLPISMQNVVCSVYGVIESKKRFGGVFHDRLSSLLESEHWDAEAIRAYRYHALKECLMNAIHSIPWYRNRAREAGITDKDILANPLDALGKLPILKKEDIHRHWKEMIRESTPLSALIKGHTSGTTGKSLTFYRSAEAIQFQWAVWWRHRARFGCKLGDLHVNFTGKPATPLSQMHPPYWRYNRAIRQYNINMHHVTRDKISDIVRFLNSISPRFYSGYPSIIGEVARLALEKELELRSRSKPVAIFTGAENTFSWQKQALEEWTGAKVTDQYGSSEGCGNASKCEYDNYHEDFEFSFLEWIDAETLHDGSRRGKLICTDLANPDMPFIRYDIGDIGIWAPDEFTCPCGRQSRVIFSIDGRIEDFILTPEGRRIMRFDYLFKDTHYVQEAQVCQYKKGSITMKIVRRKGYSLRDDEEIKRQVAKWISPLLQVDIEYVESIDREPNGKLRAVKSFLKN